LTEFENLTQVFRQYANKNMIQLNYKEFGQGEPVIILHGLFGTLDNWQTIAKQLGETHLVYILDLRNHGKSPHTEGVMSYHILAEDVALFMQQNWIHSATIIGHSMGGKVSMQMSMDYPDLVEKLIVVDIAPKKYKGGHEEIFDALLNLDLSKLTDRKVAEVYLMDKLKNDVGTVQFLLKNLSRHLNTEGVGNFEWKMNLPVLNRDYHILMDTFEVNTTFDKDTLFIRGGNSNYIRDEDFETIKSIFSKAKLETVEGAGHWVHAEKPKELLEKMLKFL
jgi:esterase